MRCGAADRSPGRVHGTRLHWRLSMHSGIVDRPSNHSVEQTVDRLKSILQGKGVTLVCPDRPQRRGRKGGNGNASYQVACFRRSQSEHTAHACCSQHCHRPTSKDSGVGRQSRESLDFLQQSGVPEGTAPCASGLGSESRGRRDGCGQGRGVMMLSHRTRARGLEPTTSHRMCGLPR